MGDDGRKNGHPLERVSTSDQVLHYLRKRIASGALQPGARVVELEISRALRVSRSPIREALMRLAQEGLVTIMPYRGAIVTKLDPSQLTELFDFRVALEEFAVARVIQVAGDAAIEKMRRQISRIRKAASAGDRAGAIEANFRQHQLLIALAQNSLLERAYAEMVAQLQLYIRVTSAYYERIEELAEEHERLCDALIERDVEKARQILRLHIEHGFGNALREL